MGKKIGISVMGRFAAAKVLTSSASKSYTHVISFGTNEPEQFPPSGFSEHSGKKLRLIFHDVTWSRHNLIAPEHKQIVELINFIKTDLGSKDSNFLIHCWAGQSRSTAAALILIQIIHNDVVAACKALLNIVPHAKPNLLMIKYADSILSCGGKLIEAVEVIHENAKKV